MHSQWWTAADAYTLDKVDKIFDRHRWTDNKPSVKDSSYFTINHADVIFFTATYTDIVARYTRFVSSAIKSTTVKGSLNFRP